MARDNKNDNRKQQVSQNNDSKSKKLSNESYDELAEQSERNQTRKPGSQSNSSKQNNNGRGGGK